MGLSWNELKVPEFFNYSLFTFFVLKTCLQKRISDKNLKSGNFQFTSYYIVFVASLQPFYARAIKNNCTLHVDLIVYTIYSD